MLHVILILVFTLCTLQNCDCARILVIIPTPSYSHQVSFQTLWKELSLRGHRVTTITTDIINDPKLVNLTEIDLKSSYKTLIEYRKEIIYSKFPKSVYIFYSLLIKICDSQFEHPDVKALIQNPKERFDLVIVETGRWPYVAFAKKFNCPLILISSLSMSNWVSSLLGNPVHPTVNPDFMVGGVTTLWNRVFAVVYDTAMSIYSRTTLMWLSQSIADKHFGNNYANIANIIENASLSFTSTDTVFDKIRPTLPNIIEIGSNLREDSRKALPKELQVILDNAVDGFVYFSLGSNVKCEELPKHTLEVIVETFAELPYLVLGKFDESLPNKLKNVITQKWWPQEAVLSHPNIKLFITQGGVQSLQEARYYNVATVGMPIFADQEQNVLNMVSRGMGLLVDHRSINKNTFKATILEVIQNPKYRETVQELNNLAQDEPMTGLEKAVWWIEFVIRHKGAKHLRSPFLDVPSYQYYLLDVFAVLIIAALIVISVIIYLIRLLLKRIIQAVLGKSYRKKQD